MSIKTAGEKLQWFLTLANTLHDLRQVISPKPTATTTPDKTEPSEKPQPKPGTLGLSLEDERIFNGVLCQLEMAEQLLITDFLSKKCKDFQRNRFINVVAGMEAEAGVPAKHERAWDKRAGKPIVVTFPAIPGKDRRQEFLKKFAEILGDQTNASKAFDYVIGGRTILKDSNFDTLKKEAREIRKERNAIKTKKASSGKNYESFLKTAFTFKRRGK